MSKPASERANPFFPMVAGLAGALKPAIFVGAKVLAGSTPAASINNPFIKGGGRNSATFYGKIMNNNIYRIKCKNGEEKREMLKILRRHGYQWTGGSKIVPAREWVLIDEIIVVSLVNKAIAIDASLDDEHIPPNQIPLDADMFFYDSTYIEDDDMTHLFFAESYDDQVLNYEQSDVTLDEILEIKE